MKNASYLMARWQIWRKISTYTKATIDNNNMGPIGPRQLVAPPRDLAWVKRPHGIQTMALGIRYGKEYNNNMRPFGPSQLVAPPRDLAWVKQPHGIQTMALGIKYGKEYGVSAKATNDDNITQFVAIWPKPSGDTAT